jgi:CMP-N-acetylneuraminic acid synthetase
MNASVYVFEREYLVDADSVHGPKTAVSEMPPERSVDIDRSLDLAFVTFLMEEWGVDYD